MPIEIKENLSGGHLNIEFNDINFPIIRSHALRGNVSGEYRVS